MNAILFHKQVCTAEKVFELDLISRLPKNLLHADCFQTSLSSKTFT